MRKVSGVLGLVAWLGCALLLAACTGSGEHAASTSSHPSAPAVTSATAQSSATSASATPSAPQTGPLLTGHGVSPGEKPPTRPTQSLPHTSDGAIVFAGYVYRAYDWSVATTNTYLLAQISAPTCTSCSRLVTKINLVEAAGGYSVSGRIVVNQIAIAHGDLVPAEYVFQIRFTQGDEIIVQSPGAAPSSYAPGKNPLINYLYLGWGPSGWQVLEIGAVKS